MHQASWLVSLLRSYAEVFQIDLAFVIQGNSAEELPEKILATVRVSNPCEMLARKVE